MAEAAVRPDPPAMTSLGRDLFTYGLDPRTRLLSRCSLANRHAVQAVGAGCGLRYACAFSALLPSVRSAAARRHRQHNVRELGEE